MPTIAISRLLGSCAGEIAQRVARSLDYDLVDKALLQRVFAQYGLTKFGKLYTNPPNLWDLANSNNLQIISMLSDAMEALAHRPRTIVLIRGGYAKLCEFDHTLNIRIQASFETRLQRILQRSSFSNREEAAKHLIHDDKARKLFLRRFYNKHWDHAGDFDLVLDTDLIPSEVAEKWIIEAAELLAAKNLRSTTESPSIHPVLKSVIEECIQS